MVDGTIRREDSPLIERRLESQTNISGTACIKRLRALNVGTDKIDDYGKVIETVYIKIKWLAHGKVNKYRIDSIDNTYVYVTMPPGNRDFLHLESKLFEPEFGTVSIIDIVDFS